MPLSLVVMIFGSAFLLIGIAFKLIVIDLLWGLLKQAVKVLRWIVRVLKKN